MVSSTRIDRKKMGAEANLEELNREESKYLLRREAELDLE